MKFYRIINIREDVTIQEPLSREVLNMYERQNNHGDE